MTDDELREVLVAAVSERFQAGLVVDTAVCVVDQQEGGAEALARRAVRLQAVFQGGELPRGAKTPAKPHG